MNLGKGSKIKKWLDSDPSLEKFKVLLTRKRLAPSTAYSYAKSVKRYVDYLHAESPKQALSKVQKWTVKQRTESIDTFITYLLDAGMHTSTVAQLIRCGLKKWFILNNVEVNWIRVQAEMLPGIEVLVEDRMPTKEELKQLLNVGSLRDRVQILVSTSSGLRIGTFVTLRLDNIMLDEPVPRVIVKRKPGRKISRKMKAFATFITPEAKKMLLQYLEHREKLGEKITGLSPILTSDRKEELGNFLSSVHMSSHWRRLLKRAHLATKNGGPWHDIHLHTLRKYFETQCTNAGVKTSYREFWMGHIGRHLEEAYFRGEVETHLEEYRKAVPFLNVMAASQDEVKSMVEKIKLLEANGKRKDKELERLRIRRDEQLVELQEAMKAIKKRLGNLERK